MGAAASIETSDITAMCETYTAEILPKIKELFKALDKTGGTKDFKKYKLTREYVGVGQAIKYNREAITAMKLIEPRVAQAKLDVSDDEKIAFAKVLRAMSGACQENNRKYVSTSKNLKESLEVISTTSMSFLDKKEMTKTFGKSGGDVIEMFEKQAAAANMGQAGAGVGDKILSEGEFISAMTDIWVRDPGAFEAQHKQLMSMANSPWSPKTTDMFVGHVWTLGMCLINNFGDKTIFTPTYPWVGNGLRKVDWENMVGEDYKDIFEEYDDTDTKDNGNQGAWKKSMQAFFFGPMMEDSDGLGGPKEDAEIRNTITRFAEGVKARLVETGGAPNITHPQNPKWVLTMSPLKEGDTGKLIEDPDEFKDACSQEGYWEDDQGDDEPGWAENKAEKLGAACEVFCSDFEGTVTVKFEDGVMFCVPVEAFIKDA